MFLLRIYSFIFCCIYIYCIKAEEELQVTSNGVAIPVPADNNNDATEIPSVIVNNVPLFVLSPNLPVTFTSTTTETIISTTTELPEYRRNCFFAEPNLCQTHFHETPPTKSMTHPSHHAHHQRDMAICQCRLHPTIPNSWYCCNITHMTMITTCGNVSSWDNLHIFNMSMSELDLSHSVYQTLQSLAITDGNITRAVNAFSRMSSVKCLNISNNKLIDISMRALSSLPNLKFLNISRNNLTRIPNWNQNQNITVDVSGNRLMLCKPLLEAVFSDSIKFVDPETSFCLLNNTYSWFNSTEFVSIKQLETARRFHTECPVIPGYGNCTCTAEHMLIVGDQSKPSAQMFCRVDCSNMGLLELPPKLPENTFSLNISYNNITSIGNHFHSNPTYQSIVKLWADNNQITSLTELEGTEFMEHFQRLYLRNNALTTLPEYLLSNVLEGEMGRTIFLGGNKLQCDCNSAKVLKLWLLERSRDIPDYTEILCRNMPQRVIDLQEIKLCQSPHDWTDYIYYLIAAEVFLLVALITKVSYDYWVFKTAGYLPWPASKMPKLPCDWLCE